ncbi:hypothetical protein F5148DRAFT_1150266 [Russula earlei]|uniref:Uncharacterized protein n=1 Tax=Russula earlei TaxID=71964 RepID=A0ACC0U4W5_9AGAM|nr:hypothetical protein F5148DRAFT_1150266 [Russula earlei]
MTEPCLNLLLQVTWLLKWKWNIGRVMKKQQICNEINISAKKVKENRIEGTQSKYSHMVKAMYSGNPNQMDINGSDASPRKQKCIDKWAATIPATAKPTFQTPRSTSSCTKSEFSLPTSGPSHLLAPSVLPDNVKIISSQASSPVKVKAKLVPELSMYDDGGLSDNDETKGKEWEVTINSPPKGKKWVTSEVVIIPISDS